MTETLLAEAVSLINKKKFTKPRLGLVLGSGLANLASTIRDETEFSFRDIPGFHAPTVEGHPGKLIFGHLAEVPVVVMQGRLHAYEGLPMAQVVYPVRLIAALGVQELLLTNAAGGLKARMRPGDFMVITDHINLTGENPLRGPNWPGGPRFVDMTGAYDPELSKKLSRAFTRHKVRAHQGVYVGVMGPSYESAAEIRYFGQIGGSAVGMSTVAETIAARHLGVKVVALSCITNLGTGLSRTKLDHAEVKETAARVEGDLTNVVLTFLEHFKST